MSVEQVVDLSDDGFALEPADMAAACLTDFNARLAKSSRKHVEVSTSSEESDRASH